VPVDPADILKDVAPENVPLSEPPSIANYREADMQGISCAFCTKFAFTGIRQDEDGNDIPVGVCEQWEANVDGVHVSDRFASGLPVFDENGNEVWDFSDLQKNTMAEVHLAGTEAREEEGFVVKEVLRTGEWPVIPTRGGIVEKSLKIVRNGRSNPDEGIIAMEELVENFHNGPIRSPQIPLSDDDDDHKNLTALNQGFVRDLWIVDEGDDSKLVAKMQFTETDTRDKVLRGTYADVSCGIPWYVKSRGQTFGSCLEHVAITNRPFIDGLGPFMAASDREIKDEQIVHFGLLPEPQKEEPPKEGEEEQNAPTRSANELLSEANVKLVSQLALSSDYQATDLTKDGFVVKNTVSDMSWVVSFKLGEDGAVSLARVEDWTTIETEGEEEAPAEQTPAAPRQLTELEAAQELRQIRLSERPSTTTKEGNMPLTREEMDALNLSEEQRAAFKTILDENVTLSAKTRTSEADKRVAELEELGLKDRPGFLKLYRQVMLSDDGGPAVVLLSDNGSDKERLTAKAILDRAIDALTVDGKVVLSDQHLASGNDDPPPATADGEQKPVADRVADARAALGLSAAKS
jgi:hypothetical protein